MLDICSKLLKLLVIIHSWVSKSSLSCLVFVTLQTADHLQLLVPLIRSLWPILRTAHTYLILDDVFTFCLTSCAIGFAPRPNYIGHGIWDTRRTQKTVTTTKNGSLWMAVNRTKLITPLTMNKLASGDCTTKMVG